MQLKYTNEKYNKMAKQKMVLVPEQWLNSLLENAKEFEVENEKWEYGNSIINDRIHFKAVALMGYAKSTSTILKYNKRIDEV